MSVNPGHAPLAHYEQIEEMMGELVAPQEDFVENSSGSSGFDYKSAAFGAATGFVAFFVVAEVWKRFRRSKDVDNGGWTRANDNQESLL